MQSLPRRFTGQIIKLSCHLQNPISTTSKLALTWKDKDTVSQEQKVDSPGKLAVAPQLSFFTHQILPLPITHVVRRAKLLTTFQFSFQVFRFASQFEIWKIHTLQLHPLKRDYC